jgi:hypothetical protein
MRRNESCKQEEILGQVGKIQGRLDQIGDPLPFIPDDADFCIYAQARPSWISVYAESHHRVTAARSSDVRLFPSCTCPRTASSCRTRSMLETLSG